MATIHKSKEIEENVYDKSLDRIHHLFNTYDNVVVMFSGGKDSTAVLQLCLEVKKQLKIDKPLDVVFIDEECIHPPTIEYVERVSKWPDVNLKWFCLPIRHRNSCSYEEPWWYCWDRSKKELWVRELPKQGITEHPNFIDDADMDVESFIKLMFEGKYYAVVMGIRTQESLRRYRAIASKKGDFAWLRNYKRPIKVAKKKHRYVRAINAYPIYDWKSEDVWKYVSDKGFDYNKTYDIFNKTHLFESWIQQRVCPPFGEEPVRSLHLYKECFPELWEKMLNRVQGVATAMRYANSELYGHRIGRSKHTDFKPENMTWRKYFDVFLDNYEGQEKRAMKGRINTLIRTHYRKTNDKIPDGVPHIITGASWKFFCRLALKGDRKDRQGGSMHRLGTTHRESKNITEQEALIRHGKK